MKKRIGSLLLILALCFTLLPTAVMAEKSVDAWDGSVAESFAGGTGTEEDPYQIANGAQLAYLAQFVNSDSNNDCAGECFVLTADIDLANNDWTPIGNSFADVLFDGPDYRLFAGNLDGKGHTISNISIGTESTPLESDVFGLFGATEGKISNLNLHTVSIHGIAKVASIGAVVGFAGGLVGSSGGSIENCHVTGLTMDMSAPSNVYAAAYWVGGLVGALDGTQLINECSVSGGITEKAGKGSIGGLIGELGKAAKITYSRSNVTVNVKADSSGGADVGGFIGKGNGKTDAETVIRNCYATGNVTGGAYTGGFAGGLWGLNIKNCYASGNVSQAAVAMASFVGTDASDPNYYGSITNCFTTGIVTGSSPSLYAFAMQDATERSKITNCYFAVENLGIKNQNESATEKPQDEMKNEAFAAALNGSDDSNGWSFVNGQILCGAEPADYSAVEAAKAAIPTVLTVYTDESVAALNTAVDGVVKGKAFVSQANVDAMAQAIKDAIAALQYKGADYTKVDEAIAKANRLNKDNYKDFSAVEAAVNAVVRDKNITEQSEVDAMAKAIEDAIAALEQKPSSGGDDNAPTYAIEVDKDIRNGEVTANRRYAERGDTVTITVKPDDGFKLDDLTVTDKNGKELKLTDKGNGKYTFTMPAGKVEINAAFVKEVETSPFSDVSTSAYYYEAVKWAQEKGITGGIGNGLFGPNQPCTRAQIVTFLWRAAGSPVVNYAMNMTDVAEDAYYAGAVRWALSEGITTGTGDGKFSPDTTCTRAQSVTFLFRAIGKLVDSKAEFSDVLTDSYYANAVAWAVENGVTNGIGNGLFGPDNSCTRAQIVTFLFRAYQGK